MEERKKVLTDFFGVVGCAVAALLLILVSYVVAYVHDEAMVDFDSAEDWVVAVAPAGAEILRLDDLDGHYLAIARIGEKTGLLLYMPPPDAGPWGHGVTMGMYWVDGEQRTHRNVMAVEPYELPGWLGGVRMGWRFELPSDDPGSIQAIGAWLKYSGFSSSTDTGQGAEEVRMEISGDWAPKEY